MQPVTHLLYTFLYLLREYCNTTVTLRTCLSGLKIINHYYYEIWDHISYSIDFNIL